MALSGLRGPGVGPRIRRATLSQHGLAANAQHPLLRTVSLDRAFYRPLDSATYRRLAAQVPEHFRFVVKAPAVVSDAVLRNEGRGAPLEDNPLFLSPQAALALCVRPAVEGLGDKLGVIVFQVSPLPRRWLQPGALLQPLASLWEAVLPALPSGTSWNLQRGLRYVQAKASWEPFDRLRAPDLPTRTTLARVLRATAPSSPSTTRPRARRR